LRLSVLTTAENLRMVVARVHSVYPDGHPESVTFLRQEAVCELSEDPRHNNFVLVWAPESALQLRGPNAPPQTLDAGDS